MPLVDIHHIAIKVPAGKLKKAEEFYTKALGLSHASRPDLGFPGAWLNVESTMIHLVEHEFSKKLDPWYRRPEAKSAIDHIAIKAHNFDETKRRLIKMKLDWRQTHLPDAGLWQLFVLDPSGVVVELNFKIDEEPPGSIGADNSRPYPPMVTETKMTKARGKKPHKAKKAKRK
jgi:catechol 2,3-dioxygenase-like lactoylglutathione lyase family enzyme